jgi:ABC-type amino acid transport substrate-binding protein
MHMLKCLSVIVHLTLVFVIGLFITQPTFAQQTSNGDAIKVSTRAVAPFVIKQDGKLEGFSIELWQALSNVMG